MTLLRSPSVAVMGSGIAASVIAILLARESVRVVVFRLPAEMGSSPLIGETLSPEGAALLRKCSLGSALQKTDGHLLSPGNIISWGAAEAHCRDFVLGAKGPGWQLDRPTFERRLQSMAMDAGTTFLDNASDHVVRRSAQTGRWTAPVELDKSASEFHFVVDATGKSSAFARRQGAQRVASDRLVCLFGRFPAEIAEARFRRDTRTWIEAAPQGWWYSGLVPGEKRVIALFTDSTLVPSSLEARTRFFHSAGRDQVLFRGINAGLAAWSKIPIETVYASSSYASRMASNDWLAVGDAACSFDPISGQGIALAIQSASRAATAIFARLRGNTTAFEDYAVRLLADWHQHDRQRASYYGAEVRWLGEPFWALRSRRQTNFDLGEKFNDSRKIIQRRDVSSHTHPHSLCPP